MGLPGVLAGVRGGGGRHAVVFPSARVAVKADVFPLSKCYLMYLFNSMTSL